MNFKNEPSPELSKTEVDIVRNYVSILFNAFYYHHYKLYKKKRESDYCQAIDFYDIKRRITFKLKQNGQGLIYMGHLPNTYHHNGLCKFTFEVKNDEVIEESIKCKPLFLSGLYETTSNYEVMKLFINSNISFILSYLMAKSFKEYIEKETEG